MGWKVRLKFSESHSNFFEKVGVLMEGEAEEYEGLWIGAMLEVGLKINVHLSEFSYVSCIQKYHRRSSLTFKRWYTQKLSRWILKWGNEPVKAKRGKCGRACDQLDICCTTCPKPTHLTRYSCRILCKFPCLAA